jgi:hypothetical protein
MFDVMFRSFLILSSLALLTGCLSQSQIQSKYVKSQAICRAETAKLFSSGEGATVADGQGSIAAKFSECMSGAGWHLSSAKPGVPQPTNPPTGSPSTNPSAATSVARTTPPQNPPSGAPSVNPSAAAAKQVPATSPATIGQPARPVSVPNAPYGTGGGRNF